MSTTKIALVTGGSRGSERYGANCAGKASMLSSHTGVMKEMAQQTVAWNRSHRPKAAALHLNMSEFGSLDNFVNQGKGVIACKMEPPLPLIFLSIMRAWAQQCRLKSNGKNSSTISWTHISKASTFSRRICSDAECRRKDHQYFNRHNAFQQSRLFGVCVHERRIEVFTKYLAKELAQKESVQTLLHPARSKPISTMQPFAITPVKNNTAL